MGIGIKAIGKNEMKAGGNLSVKKTLLAGARVIDLTQPKIMGILNVTPDSFYAKSRQPSEADILKTGATMMEEGATFLDVGGYSSRPGAVDISEDEELKRVVSAIRVLVREFPEAIISIDTFRSGVAREAIRNGASMINDISGGTLDHQMFDTVAELQVPYVLMHMRGTPQTMKTHTHYDNLATDIIDYFHRQLAALHARGIKDVVLDPGFGFAKTREQNFELLRQLDVFQITGQPLLVGLSRKSMIWKTLDTTPEESLNGSTVLHTIAVMKGASILRVHDVREAMEVIRLTHSMVPPI